jgi:hypothetical protein
MRAGLVGALALLVAGCESTQFHMPDFISYPSACPQGNNRCQRNLDAQTLRYIGDDEAATKLMCMDPSLRPLIDTCGAWY